MVLIFLEDKDQNHNLSKVRDNSSRVMYYGPWGTPGEPGSLWEAGEAARGFEKARVALGPGSCILSEMRS